MWILEISCSLNTKVVDIYIYIFHHILPFKNLLGSKREVLKDLKTSMLIVRVLCVFDHVEYSFRVSLFSVVA